jgi:hypothetical protein
MVILSYNYWEISTPEDLLLYSLGNVLFLGGLCRVKTELTKTKLKSADIPEIG